MARYLCVVFSDLQRHSDAWTKIPRDRMAGLIAEYRYIAETLAGQYGCLYREWAGDGHMFLFETADASVQFSLRLIEDWKDAGGSGPRLTHLPLRLGSHFGECIPMDGTPGWIGRANGIAKRVESEAAPDALFVTENVLDLIDLPLYGIREAGVFTLKGDSLPRRTLYEVTSFDRNAFAAKPAETLDAQEWFLRGVTYVGTEQENSEEEARCYREALRLRPEFAEAHTNLAILLRARGELTDAVRHYQEALRLRPDYPDAHYSYATLLTAKGNVPGAAEHYREALHQRPDYVDAHHGLANLLKEQGGFDQALQHYRETLRLRPEYPEAHNNLAVLLEAMGVPDEAEMHYQEALRLRPNYPEAHYNFALLLEGRGRESDAEKHYREAVRLWPEYPEAHNNLAVLLHLRGDLVEAEPHYREALRLRPEDPETHYNYALLLKARGEMAEAERHLKIASELAPDRAAFKSAIEPPV